MGAATLALIMKILNEPWPAKKHWKELFILGAVAVAIPHFLYNYSALKLPASYGSVMMITSVLFGVFASAWLKEDKLTAVKIGGSVIGFSGVALIVQLGPANVTSDLLIGAITCGGAAFCSGLATPLLKRATTRMQPLAITASMHLTASILLSPFAITSLPQAGFSWYALGCLFITGVITSGLAYWQYMRIMIHISPIAALSTNFMITGFGVFWAYLFVGEAVTSITFVGAVLVSIATIMVSGYRPWAVIDSSKT
jgi:drug/metabolite transporter (DMT)-like permease